MADTNRKARPRSLRLESLEERNLLSLLGGKPTLNVVDGPNVRHHGDQVYITQPASIQVFGTAQPGVPGTNVQVTIYGEDSSGNLVQGGVPLATVRPDPLGRYHAVIELTTLVPRDVNFLVARETATATQVSDVAINATTISGLQGNLAVDPGTLSGLNGTVAHPANTISGINGTVSNPANTLTGLGGTITTPATPISNIAGTITIPVFPTTNPGGAGTAGPAVGTTIGGTGTLGAQVGTLAGGSATLSPSVGTLAQTGNADIAASNGTFTQTGTAAESGRTGTFSNGTGDIAATTGTVTTQLSETQVSDPVVVVVHVPPGLAGAFATHHQTPIAPSALPHPKATPAAHAHPAVVHAAAVPTPRGARFVLVSRVNH